MANAIAKTLEDGKERIESLQTEIDHRVRRIRRRLENQQSMLRGRLREDGLSVVLELSAGTLDTAARIALQIPGARKGADALQHRAEALAEAKDHLGVPPIEDYDGLNVKKVTDALTGLDAFQLSKVREYEAAHKNRKTVLRAIERLLSSD